VKEPSRFLATIQVGITLSGLLASAVAAESFADRITEAFSGLPVAPYLIKLVTVIIITFLLSYVTLVFGELIPKRVAMQMPERISRFTAAPLNILSKLTRPFINFLTFSTNFFIKLFGGNPNADEEQITEEEIRMMVDVGEEKGVILTQEKEMIDNIFEFNDTTVSEIMTHRTHIVGISSDYPLEEVLDIVNSEKYTRIPVYEETIDNIIGILHVKDLIQYLLKRKEKDIFNVKNIIRKPYFVPSSKKINVLFRELQKSNTHMAVVIDEFGGTAGIVTLEDLIEEIVGNIFDEYDERENEIEKVDDNTFIIDGKTNLDNVREVLNIELPVDEYGTLSGFLTGYLGRIPAEGEKPVIELDTVVFRVEKVDEKMISKVKVCKT
ncbi:MAG: HlyC/CorC family transporter, partial [Clostridiaceae bacterium]|nr:HlyC/CorC family transporter [Clostridiaceae bacterium]